MWLEAMFVPAMVLFFCMLDCEYPDLGKPFLHQDRCAATSARGTHWKPRLGANEERSRRPLLGNEADAGCLLP